MQMRCRRAASAGKAPPPPPKPTLHFPLLIVAVRLLIIDRRLVNRNTKTSTLAFLLAMRTTFRSHFRLRCFVYRVSIRFTAVAFYCPFVFFWLFHFAFFLFWTQRKRPPQQKETIEMHLSASVASSLRRETALLMESKPINSIKKKIGKSSLK